jgi:hypothetical protein
MTRASSGAALRLLPLAIGLLTACGQQSAPVTPTLTKTAKSEVEEVDALIAATKRHPSLVDAAKNAGPAIHVDPYPHSRGAPPHPHAIK